jgi:hypothetical protein
VIFGSLAQVIGVKERQSMKKKIIYTDELLGAIALLTDFCPRRQTWPCVKRLSKSRSRQAKPAWIFSSPGRKGINPNTSA